MTDMKPTERGVRQDRRLDPSTAVFIGGAGVLAAACCGIELLSETPAVLPVIVFGVTFVWCTWSIMARGVRWPK
jgi:hypothetical protein